MHLGHLPQPIQVLGGQDGSFPEVRPEVVSQDQARDRGRFERGGLEPQGAHRNE